jgi:hypothetical protein
VINLGSISTQIEPMDLLVYITAKAGTEGFSARWPASWGRGHPRAIASSPA